MFTQRLGVYIFLGFLTLSVAYKISPIIVQDGIPDFLNVTTDPFVKIGNGYYFIQINSTKNWHAAYESCRKMNASLIYFESIEEWNLINNYLNDTGIHTKYWTSGTVLADTVGRNHVWFSTGQPMSLDIWYPGEPNNIGGSEYCDEMGRYDVPVLFWGLNDRNCNTILPYICKAQQPATVSFLVW
ncbi:hypothetical protein KR059_004455 [Drosophila kikkawai]|nr:hypothetical protein KR059_004455 [Drosophila kikkawai]